MRGGGEKRHKRLLRLLRAAEQLRRQQEMEAQALRARAEALRRRRQTLLSALDGSLLGSRMRAGPARQALAAMAREEEQLKLLEEQGRAALRQRRMQERQMQRLQARSRAQVLAEQRKGALLAVIERAAARGRE